MRWLHRSSPLVVTVRKSANHPTILSAKCDIFLWQRASHGLNQACGQGVAFHNTGDATVEAVLLIGLQGAGKSTFCRERLFATHMRLSLDLLKTRHREKRFLQTCIETGQRFV